MLQEGAEDAEQNDQCRRYVHRNTENAFQGDEQVADETVVRAATEAQRRTLLALRTEGRIGDAAFQQIQEELDWAELDWAQLLQAGAPTGEGT